MAAGGVGGDALGELDSRRVGVGPQRHERELAGLLRGGLGQLLATVTDLDHEEAGEPVEVALAGGVEEVCALPLGDHGHVRGVVGAVTREVHPEVILGSALEVRVVPLFAHGPSIAQERCLGKGSRQ
mgnify:CR=1 FL=1